ncbi:MAG: hypothetical protein LBT65_03010 [Synergistaceae bacterium]|nr:hypothetical protein [Synergistaceae bacterium]
MDDRGEILSSRDVDENVALQIWTKGQSPRLVVFNKNQNSRKLIRLNWLERSDRKLSIKGKKRGESVEFVLADLLPTLQHILSEYAVLSAFKPRLWKFSLTLEKALHTPAIVTEKGELSLLPEEKRAALWLADLTDGKRGEGFFRPFFPLADAERKAFSEEGLPIADNHRGMEDLFKTGIVRKLASLRPDRWYRPVRVMAAAILLGFSFCEEDGSEVCDAFWDDDVLLSKINDPRLMGLGRKFVGFVRHFDALDRMTAAVSQDSVEDLQKEKYARKRRIEVPVGFLGDVEYSVTFFDREDGMTALGCRPKASTLRHKGELVYTFPSDVYERALNDDARGGASDDYFTLMQLTSAKAFSMWIDGIVPYITSFVGLMQ